jgi:hypothetical protein
MLSGTSIRDRGRPTGFHTAKATLSGPTARIFDWHHLIRYTETVGETVNSASNAISTTETASFAAFSAIAVC